MAENHSLYAPALEELAALAEVIAANCRSCAEAGSVEELVAVGAASGADCQPCLDYHAQQAQELGVTAEDVRLAVAAGLAAARRPVDGSEP